MIMWNIKTTELLLLDLNQEHVLSAENNCIRNCKVRHSLSTEKEWFTLSIEYFFFLVLDAYLETNSAGIQNSFLILHAYFSFYKHLPATNKVRINKICRL
jgi:hypothetical protein